LDYLGKITNQEDIKNIFDEILLFKFNNAQHIVDVGYKETLVRKATPIPNIYLTNFSMTLVSH
jgi:hypothetical protein